MDELVSFEDQNEVKDGRDTSGNLSWTADVGETGRFSIDGFYVKTDRDVTEVSREVEYDDGDVIESNVPGLNPVDQRPFVVALEGQQSNIGRSRLRLEAGIDVPERVAPVDCRLSRAEKIQIRTMQHQHCSVAAQPADLVCRLSASALLSSHESAAPLPS
jgi:hypothetical protein